MLSTQTCDRRWPTGVRRAEYRATRSRRTSHPAISKTSRTHASAASRPVGAPESMTHPVVADLLARSNRLGADPRNTNYAGGNTSAKGNHLDPATGERVDLIWIKGSGGDLGTLTEGDLATLRLDRL